MSLEKLLTPDVGHNEVTVIEILLKVGDTVSENTPAFTLESDKATMEITVEQAGVIQSIAVKEGDKVVTGSPLLTLETGKASTQAIPEKKSENEKVQTEKKITTETPSLVSEKASNTSASLPSVSTQTQAQSGMVYAGPLVRKLARELGLELSQVTGTGNKSRITKEDVMGFVKNKLSGSQTVGGNLFPPMPSIDFSQFGDIQIQELSKIKKISGKFLQRNAAMIPHVTQFGEADITQLEAFRLEKKLELEKKNIKLTPLVFIMKAVAAALKAFPNFNASLSENGEQLILKKYIHLGVAVDTPDGLVVPVIRNVDQKNLSELALELAQVSERARNKKLLPQEMQGGCFSISSLGGIGGTAFTPIINAPEVAILGVSKSSYKPIYVKTGFEPRLMLPLSLSYDHRVIDGAEGARFMVYLTEQLSDIRNQLL